MNQKLEDAALLRAVRKRAVEVFESGLRLQLNLGDFESKARAKAGSYAVRISVNELLRILDIAEGKQ